MSKSNFRRFPSMLSSLPLRLLPFTAKQQAAYDKGGFVENIAFKTVPSSGKLQIKQVLERLYGLNVASVRTANFEGRKKRGKQGFYRSPDYKKVFVTLRKGAADVA